MRTVYGTLDKFMDKMIITNYSKSHSIMTTINHFICSFKSVYVCATFLYSLGDTPIIFLKTREK